MGAGGGANQVHYGRRCGSGVWTFGIRIINIAWKAWIFPSSDSPQIALEWCLELSLRWAHELLPRADLVDKMQRFVSNYPIKLDDLVLLCLFTASGMLALVQPPLRSENKKSIFVLHTGYGMKNVFSPSYRKFWRLFFFSNPLLERYFIRFYGFLSILAEFLLNSSILKISRRLGWILYFYDLYAEVWFTNLFRNKISNNNNMKKM